MGAINYKLYHHRDFIKTEASGKLDLEASKAMIRKMALLSENLPREHDVIFDLRGARCEPTVEDRIELVRELTRHRFAFRNKIAVLVHDEEHLLRSRFTSMCAGLEGIQVLGFMDFEEAHEWLNAPFAELQDVQAQDEEEERESR